jgi:hypothetical protein
MNENPAENLHGGSYSVRRVLPCIWYWRAKYRLGPVGSGYAFGKDKAKRAALAAVAQWVRTRGVQDNSSASA